MTRTINTDKGTATLTRRDGWGSVYDATGPRGRSTFAKDRREWSLVYKDGTGQTRRVGLPLLRDCVALAIMQGRA